MIDVVSTQGAAQGAPQARQVANRFHLLQNLRNAIEQQLIQALARQLQLAPQEIVVLALPPGLVHRYGQPAVTEHRHLVQAGRRGRSKVGFDRVKVLHDEDKTPAQIARETRFNWRTVWKWTRQEACRSQATMTPKPSTPVGFASISQVAGTRGARWAGSCSLRSGPLATRAA